MFSESHDSEKFAGMGTTLCMAIFFKNKIFVVNVGDSRAYRLESEEIVQLTKDQTYVQYMLNKGEIDEQEKLTSKDRHALMNFIGQNKDVNYVLTVKKNEAKTIMLCSDGLYNNATEEEIHTTLSTNDSVNQKLDTLIEIAKSNGGSDNIGISYWEAIDND